MEKTYNHQLSEKMIYQLWEETGSFTPEAGVTLSKTDKKPFCIIMPPPNANDNLHIGHARFIAVEDVLTRFHRMKGEAALWLPGADHAGIETQYVFEKKLREEGKSRFDFQRDELYKLVLDYVQSNKSNMENQLKALGASCDWSREKFTLDPDIIKIVYETFKKLSDDGLIYRGERIVNYCTRCGTAYSQLEVEAVEKNDFLYYLDYGSITIATTRPETIFADVAVAVNPKDKRYEKLVGKTAKLPLINRELPIISDNLVDIEFGTGALKITPGHDQTDFEIGKKHELSTISVVGKNGRMINVPEKYLGMKVMEAREAVVKDLEEAGLVKKTEPIKHMVGVCYKDKSVIEPMLSEQWFLKVKSLADAALQAIKDKKVIFSSKRYEKIARYWLENLKDWNISRQIVWGIRIPAFFCEDCKEWTITKGEIPEKCPKCKGSKITQDNDTFDTWFSSGQWPFATLKTGQKGDFEYFYPTSVMETAYDILPFWVIRMIMLGIYATGEVPFKNVLIHGLVRDRQGQKISKSKGNVINPLEMSLKYGTDALRMGIIWGSLVENDISLSEDKIRGQRNFANKIWNISRYVFMENTEHPLISAIKSTNKDDIWIINELERTVGKVTKSLDNYRLSEAAEEIYDFVWHKLADQYIEKSKPRRPEAQTTLMYVLQESLKLLHPFMPFVTESIWQNKKEYFDSPLLISAPWPK